MADPKIAWDGGEAYERWVGRWSRLVARRFLDWLQVPAGRSWLDVGCGTGELTRAIVETQSPSRVVGVDPSKPFIAAARENVCDERAEFDVGDAMSLSYAAKEFDAVVACLVLNHVPDSANAMTEMARVAETGGIIGAFVWDYEEGMQMMRRFWNAAVALDPGAGLFDQRYPLCHPDALIKLVGGAGLRGVEARAIDVPTVFRDFADYWTPFLGGQGVAPGYLASLSEDRRVALREKVRAELPVERDGSIHLYARAWGVRGTT